MYKFDFNDDGTKLKISSEIKLNHLSKTYHTLWKKMNFIYSILSGLYRKVFFEEPKSTVIAPL